jgi:hypothetical protein
MSEFMKTQAAQIIKFFLMWRLRKKQYAHIENLIRNLKLQNQYEKFPADKCVPVISKYDFFRKSDLKWLDFYYSVCGKQDPLFISVPIYYYIETCLNHRMLTYAVKEKNFYNKFLHDICTPETIVRRINGFYYNSQFHKIEAEQVLELLKEHGKVILKPSVESGGGSSIRVFERNDRGLLDKENVFDDQFLKAYTKDFIVQEYVVQHEYFSRFNPSSNNTIRVFTYRSVKDDTVNILHCLLRVGAKGSFLDHDHLGGVVLSVNEQNQLNPYAIDIYGNKNTFVNGVEISTLDQVPAMDEIKKTAIKIAGDIYYGRLLALDFTVDSLGKPLMLEINCWRNGISQYQMHNGGLFREFTEEILDYCQHVNVPYVLSL